MINTEIVLWAPPLRFWHGATRGLNPALPIPPDNVTTLTCEMQNFFIWLKISCVLSNVEGCEESQLWVVVGGSEKDRLWCVASGMSQQVFRVTTFCINTCFQTFFDTEHSTPRCAEIQPMSQQAAATSCSMSVSIHAPPVACPMHSTRAMQIIGSTEQ